MSFDDIVTLMSLNSCLVERDSETTIRVPSDRTTRSRGEMRKANGRLFQISVTNFMDHSTDQTYAIASMIKNAIYV